MWHLLQLGWYTCDILCPLLHHIPHLIESIKYSEESCVLGKFLT